MARLEVLAPAVRVVESADASLRDAEHNVYAVLAERSLAIGYESPLGAAPSRRRLLDPSGGSASRPGAQHVHSRFCRRLL